MVSGFSPNLLKLFLQGNLKEMLQKPKVDPMVTVREALDDPRYTPVRRRCAEVGEGAMAGYVVDEDANTGLLTK